MRTSRPALLFPGAGVQMSGMAADLADNVPSAAAVLDEVERATDIPVRTLCTLTPASALRSVAASYPAVFATSVAAWAALRAQVGGPWSEPAIVAGHSLGHFAALVAAGALDVAEAATFVAARAVLMEDAARRRPGAMLAVVGPRAFVLEELVAGCPEAAGVAVVACYNSDRHHVIAGDRKAMDWVADHLAGLDVERTVRVRTGLAAHSPLMRPACSALLPLIQRLPLRPPSVPVLLNTTGVTGSTVAELRADLEEQVVSPVRWTGCWPALREAGADAVVDVGPGDTLQRLAQAATDLPSFAVNGPGATWLPVAPRVGADVPSP